MSAARRVAVIGSGIAGLSAAYGLRRAHQDGGATRFDVSLFEAGSHFGGHTHTVDVRLPLAHGGHATCGVDTGFLVFNHRTYPQLTRLFDQLGVVTAPSDMSFSVQLPDLGHDGFEWSGCDLNTVFAQRANLLRPRFWRMLSDILRFNRLATAIAARGNRGDDPREGGEQAQPIGDFLAAHGFSDAFRDWYFLPMIGSIWSCPTDQMLRFPVATMVRFCHNHGLIQVTDRPQWHTVRGGARHYVEKLLAHIPDARLNTPVRRVRRTAQGVRVAIDVGSEAFDDVVFACHSDQALALLADEASETERAVLGAIRYHPNRAVLHTDAALLPRRKLAWAAWNYERAASHSREQAAVCLHYLMGRLQPLPFEQPVIVSLNPAREPAAASVLGTYDYAHPVFDLAAIDAQRRLPELQGQRHSWFCGAWTGYGFHEDGLCSGLGVAQSLIERHREQPMPQAA